MKIMKRNIDILVAAAVLLVAMLTFAYADGGFRFFGPLRRIITPNNDQKNDAAVFCFDNPADSAVSGTIYSLLGSHVADMGPKQTALPGVTGCQTGVLGQAYYIVWDGKASGVTVRSGVYIYQVRAEGLSFTGTLVVVR